MAVILMARIGLCLFFAAMYLSTTQNQVSSTRLYLSLFLFFYYQGARSTCLHAARPELRIKLVPQATLLLAAGQPFTPTINSSRLHAARFSSCHGHQEDNLESVLTFPLRGKTPRTATHQPHLTSETLPKRKSTSGMRHLSLIGS